LAKLVGTFLWPTVYVDESREFEYKPNVNN